MKKQFTSPTKKVSLLLIFTLLVFFHVSSVFAQGTTVKVQPSNTAPTIGSTLTVDITITNVQNLYGLDVSFRWDATVLKVLSATSFLGVESKPGGVLHGKINIAEEGASQTSGQYRLVAVSESPAPAFSGNGKIATLIFNVTRAGRSALTLETELADKPAPGEVSNFITHTDVSSAIDAPIPEFPTLFALLVFLVIATATLAFSKKHMRRNTVSLARTL